MRLVAVGLAEVLLVKSDDGGILVRLAELHAAVKLVDACRAGSLDINVGPLVRGADGLTAAVHTAPITSLRS